MRQITEKNYSEFKKAYEQAVKDGATQFTFKGELVLVAWAKYAIEYVEAMK